MFVRVAAIFTVFVLVLTVLNGVFLSKYYIWRERQIMLSTVSAIKQLDLSDSKTATVELSNIHKSQNFYIEIYNESGKPMYTTFGSQFYNQSEIMDILPTLRQRNLRVISQEKQDDGSWFSTEQDIQNNTVYMVYRTRTDDNELIELWMQKDFLEKSSEVANQFILIVAISGLVAVLIWSIAFTKSFARPIVAMNKITRDMADLNFERKLTPESGDEIGQLAVSINDLSEKLDWTLTDLRQKNAKLRDEIEIERQLDVMRRGFVSNVSHELKTPISIIQGYAEGLKLGISNDDEKREQYCDVILEESVRMNHLVLDILELSRYESGQITIEKSVFDIVADVKNTVHKFSNKFKQNGVTVSIDSPGSLIVSADPGRMEQVLSNFLNNAVSHVNEKGSIDIKVETAEALQSGNAEISDKDFSVRPKTERPLKVAKVSVFNTGSSISEDDMPQIWQSFYRGDQSHTRDEGRTGLGLSIVRAIMELHNRECGVYNTEKGVCFWFTADLSENTEYEAEPEGILETKMTDRQNNEQ